MSAQGFIYAIQSGDLVKIGHSKNPEGRLSKINSDTSAPCRLIGYIPGTRADEDELHRRFARLRAHSEWFRKSGIVEEFLATVPAPKPKVRAPRKPDKRTLGRPPKPAPTAKSFTPLRQKLSDDLKTVLAAFLAADVAIDHREFAIEMAESPDRYTSRQPDSAPMRGSYFTPMLFMSIHWPTGVAWPDGIERPEPLETRELKRELKHRAWSIKWKRERDERNFQKSAISALCKAHSEAA